MLKAANPEVDPMKLRPGKLLDIPGTITNPPADVPATNSLEKVFISPGQSSSNIVAVSEVEAAPASPEPYPPGEHYIVRAGDTLLSISHTRSQAGHLVTSKQLRVANPQVDWLRLKVGQVLNIP
jgi:LysM repeat protein